MAGRRERRARRHHYARGFASDPEERERAMHPRLGKSPVEPVQPRSETNPKILYTPPFFIRKAVSVVLLTPHLWRTALRTDQIRVASLLDLRSRLKVHFWGIYFSPKVRG